MFSASFCQQNLNCQKPVFRSLRFLTVHSDPSIPPSSQFSQDHHIFHSKAEVYLCKTLRISCRAVPSSSHAFANFTLSCSAFLLISCPFSLRHRSIVCRISIPTASRVPSAVSPFLASGLRPSPVLTW